MMTMLTTLHCKTHHYRNCALTAQYTVSDISNAPNYFHKSQLLILNTQHTRISVTVNSSAAHAVGIYSNTGIK